MAGSIVVTTSEITHNILRYRIVWTSDASGNVTLNTFPMAVGTIVAVEFFPGAGADTPTELYDTDLLDDGGLSLFDDGAGTSVGMNLSATVGAHRVPLSGQAGITVYRRWHHGGLVQPVVAGAGDSNKGTIDVYLSMGVM